MSKSFAMYIGTCHDTELESGIKYILVPSSSSRRHQASLAIKVLRICISSTHWLDAYKSQGHSGIPRHHKTRKERPYTRVITCDSWTVLKQFRIFSFAEDATVTSLTGMLLYGLICVPELSMARFICLWRNYFANPREQKKPASLPTYRLLIEWAWVLGIVRQKQ